MKNKKYQVKKNQGNTYQVVEMVTIFGERTSAYDSEPDTVSYKNVFYGTLSDCEAYIRLHENGYM